MWAGVCKSAPTEPMERLPLAFRLGEPVGDRVERRRMRPEAEVARIDHDVFREVAPRFRAAAPRHDAVGRAPDRGGRRRRGGRPERRGLPGADAAAIAGARRAASGTVHPIYSRSDGIVACRACRQAEGPLSENVEVRGARVGLGFNPAALWVISDTLGQPLATWAPFRPSSPVAALFPGERGGPLLTPSRVSMTLETAVRVDLHVWFLRVCDSGLR